MIASCPSGRFLPMTWAVGNTDGLFFEPDSTRPLGCRGAFIFVQIRRIGLLRAGPTITDPPKLQPEGLQIVRCSNICALRHWRCRHPSGCFLPMTWAVGNPNGLFFCRLADGLPGLRFAAAHARDGHNGACQPRLLGRGRGLEDCLGQRDHIRHGVRQRVTNTVEVAPFGIAALVHVEPARDFDL